MGRRHKRGLHHSPKLIGEAHFRSGWEQKYMIWLDKNPDVVSYQYEPVAIPYLSNKKTGRTRRYFPDLMIAWADGRVEVVEIKPLKYLHRLVNQKKIITAGDWCRGKGISFRVVTEVDLKALGLLLKGLALPAMVSYGRHDSWDRGAV